MVNNFSFFEKRVVYEIMWKNTVEWSRQQMTICNTYFSSNETMVARTCITVTFYVRCLSCWI